MFVRVLMLMAITVGTLQAQAPVIEGAGEKIPEKEPYTLVKIKPRQGQFIWVLPWSKVGEVPPPIELFKGESGEIAWTGPPGTYAILWGDTDGQQGQSYVVIKSPGPVPPPDPDDPDPPSPPGPAPRPDGFAGQVYDAAIALKDPVTAKAIAADYQMIATKINAGGITTIVQLMDEVKAVNEARVVPKSWQPFAVLISQRAEQLRATPNVKIKEDFGEYFEQVVKGLEATYVAE